MLAEIVTGILGFALFVYWYGWLSLQWRWQSLGLPGPEPKPFVGSSGELFVKGYHIAHREWMNTYGRMVGFMQGRQPCVLLSDPEAIRQIGIKFFESFHNRPYPPFRLRVTTGLVFARDEIWRKIRRTVAPSFNAITLKSTIPAMNHAAQVLVDRMGKVKDGESIDMLVAYGKMTLDVVGTTSFGTVFNSQEVDDDPMVKLTHQMFADGGQLLIGNIFSTVAPAITPIFRFFPTASMKRTLTAGKILDDRAWQIIQQRRSGAAKMKMGPQKDLLDMLLNAKDKETGQGLTDAEILHQAMTFLLAGYETTANTLAFTTYFLAQSEEVQSKLIEEVDRVIGDEDVPTYEQIRDMTYLEQVINEGLRLFPPGGVLLREVCEDTEVKGYKFKKGTTVAMPTFAIHRDPEFWEEPERFNPDRFSKEEVEKRDPGCFIPFGVGQRMCVGMRFAMLEAKITLIKIYQNYRLTLSKKTTDPLKVRPGLTLSAIEGIHVHVVPRVK
eukprot:GFYU01007743.1.p1 GENE.GFYU01007743.1~~GFYU01007743.1.p1  ORF type:complete len:497 (-),score=176.20 GFYU01007743.1:187-1677(-)